MTKLFSLILVVVAACVVPPQSNLQTQPEVASAPVVTGIYVNGQELTLEQKAQLEQILGGQVPQGRYTLDAQYNFGIEGQAAVVNLAALTRQQPSTQQASAQPYSMYSTDAAGRGSSLVDDGHGCMIVSTPDGSMSTGC